jgi:hypothetical protein
VNDFDKKLVPIRTDCLACWQYFLFGTPHDMISEPSVDGARNRGILRFENLSPPFRGFKQLIKVRQKQAKMNVRKPNPFQTTLDSNTGASSRYTHHRQVFVAASIAKLNSMMLNLNASTDSSTKKV